jgi:hypothetical protein
MATVSEGKVMGPVLLFIYFTAFTRVTTTSLSLLRSTIKLNPQSSQCFNMESEGEGVTHQRVHHGRAFQVIQHGQRVTSTA